MLLFWKVLLLFPVPRLAVPIVVPPEPTPNSVAAGPLPTRLTFLTVLLVAASAPAVVCIQMSAEVVPTFVLVIVKSRDDVPLLEPSMIIQSAPFKTINALALEPVIVIPAALGLIVTVFVALDPPFAL